MPLVTTSSAYRCGCCRRQVRVAGSACMHTMCTCALLVLVLALGTQCVQGHPACTTSYVRVEKGEMAAFVAGFLIGHAQTLAVLDARRWDTLPSSWGSEHDQEEVDKIEGELQHRAADCQGGERCVDGRDGQ